MSLIKGRVNDLESMLLEKFHSNSNRLNMEIASLELRLTSILKKEIDNELHALDKRLSMIELLMHMNIYSSPPVSSQVTNNLLDDNKCHNKNTLFDNWKTSKSKMIK
jgi:hypothetical protein